VKRIAIGDCNFFLVRAFKAICVENSRAFQFLLRKYRFREESQRTYSIYWVARKSFPNATALLPSKTFDRMPCHRATGSGSFAKWARHHVQIPYARKRNRYHSRDSACGLTDPLPVLPSGSPGPLKNTEEYRESLPHLLRTDTCSIRRLMLASDSEISGSNLFTSMLVPRPSGRPTARKRIAATCSGNSISHTPCAGMTCSYDC
jgi:hypothetical protein